MIDLKAIGEYENTLIVVTADHGHGFVSVIIFFPADFLSVVQDVFGGADTKYLAAQTDDRKKRGAGKITRHRAVV